MFWKPVGICVIYLHSLGFFFFETASYNIGWPWTHYWRWPRTSQPILLPRARFLQVCTTTPGLCITEIHSGLPVLPSRRSASSAHRQPPTVQCKMKHGSEVSSCCSRRQPGLGPQHPVVAHICESRSGGWGASDTVFYMSTKHTWDIYRQTHTYIQVNTHT